jgi:hypothetical protein
MSNVSDLLINGQDAYQQYGVRMGDGFLSALRAGAPMKDYITNDSRLKDGVEYCETVPKLSERDITLQFTIEGSTPSDYETKYDSFLAVLQAGDVTVQVPARSEKIYHLKYTGKQITYAESIDGTFSKFSAKFKEPDPTFRTAERPSVT